MRNTEKNNKSVTSFSVPIGKKMEVSRIVGKKLIVVRHLLGIRHCLKCFLCQLVYPHNRYNRSLIMQLKKVRHRKIKSST